MRRMLCLCLLAAALAMTADSAAGLAPLRLTLPDARQVARSDAHDLMTHFTERPAHIALRCHREAVNIVGCRVHARGDRENLRWRAVVRRDAINDVVVRLSGLRVVRR